MQFALKVKSYNNYKNNEILKLTKHKINVIKILEEYLVAFN